MPGDGEAEHLKSLPRYVLWNYSYLKYVCNIICKYLISPPTRVSSVVAGMEQKEQRPSLVAVAQKKFIQSVRQEKNQHPSELELPLKSENQEPGAPDIVQV